MNIPLTLEVTVLGPESAGLLMTPEEFDAITEYDECYRYELINGVVVVSPIPLPQERSPNDLLGHHLFNYQEQHPQGTSLNLTLPQEYVKTLTGRRIADRLIWASMAAADVNRYNPNVAVEFVSGSRRDWQRDYVDKRKEYAEVKIVEYWIINRFERTLTVIRNLPTGQEEIVIHENETYESPLLPGFKVPLAELLKAADRMVELD